MVNPVKSCTRSLELLLKVLVNPVQLGFGQEPSRNCGLVSDNDCSIARIFQFGDRIIGTRNQLYFFWSCNVAAFYVDGPVAVQKHCRPGHNTPLVEGIPPTRGSGSQAIRNARATALNIASTP